MLQHWFFICKIFLQWKNVIHAAPVIFWFNYIQLLWTNNVLFVAVSSWPIASAFATLHSASLLACNICISQLAPCPCIYPSTYPMPLPTPAASSSFLLAVHKVSCLGNQMGTLSTVFSLVCQGEASEEHWRVGWWSWRWLCFLPGLAPILLTFKASFARAL